MSRAGVALLRELTISTGLGTGWSQELLDAYDGTPVHLPGRVLADLAVMIADGGNALAHLATLRDQDKLFGAVASDATAWRVLGRVDDEHLTRLRTVRAAARERAWAAGAGPDLTAGLTIDIDDQHRAQREGELGEKRGKRPSGFIRCRPTSTGPTSPAGKHWPGFCDRAKPGPTPPPTMPRSWRWRWPRSPPAHGPTPMIPTRHG
ncbi:hypothetical protein AMETH_2415 [Amycolatopsis methanolica 239]|uniref:Uncharacterized protein n=1 Tax=Amycolatopsis methanolica 239 TaxID=1068978 RepID=A0A076MXZ2_AMYME|nr:hypothetical protein AMETH_2415 [Amycolatopsis methanolica 239]